jgi:hypothetical protein
MTGLRFFRPARSRGRPVPRQESCALLICLKVLPPRFHYFLGPLARDFCLRPSLGRMREQATGEIRMPRPRSTAGAEAAMATREDLLRLVGDVDERKVFDILALNPTVAEIEQAALWAAGDGDVLGKSGYPLRGTAAEVFDILAADEEEEPPIR